MYRRLAEIARQYLKRQSSVFGRQNPNRKYQGSGIERTALDIIANEVMLGGGNSEQQAQAETPTPPRRQAATLRPLNSLTTTSARVKR